MHKSILVGNHFESVSAYHINNLFFEVSNFEFLLKEN